MRPVKNIKKFFPGLLTLLNSVADPRDTSRIIYQSKMILFTRIISAIFRFPSMRRTTAGLNNENTVLNVANIVGQPLEELPHWSTINNYLERLDPQELADIIPKLVKSLISMQTFKGGKIRNKYWQVLIDGTRLFMINEDDSENNLYKVHRNPDGTVKWVEYYCYVVEAKLLLPNNIVISILTEFCENDEGVSPDAATEEGQEQKKQDCELKAFYRMEERLKEIFGNMKICLTLDSLYACERVFELCERNNWRYIVRFKEGSIPSIADEFSNAARETTRRYHKIPKGSEVYEYLVAHNYKGHYLNAVRYSEEGRKYPFFFLTNLPISAKNCVAFVVDGRNRWKIENQGFNIQKNHGFELTHKFSMNSQAIKNHYYLIQIAHAISQLFEHEFDILKELKMTQYEIHDLIKNAFMCRVEDVHIALDDSDSV